MKQKQLNMYFHVHHQSLAETSNDIQERIDYINKFKDKFEVPLRLKLIKKVKLPVKLQSQLEALQNARNEINELHDDSLSAYSELNADHEILHTYENLLDSAVADVDDWLIANTNLDKLHKQQCKNCPWDGNTIFTRKRKSGYWY